MPEPIREAMARLTTGQKIKLGVALVAVLGVVWGVSLYATRVRYGVLFSNIETDDANGIVAALKERNIPYRLSAGGTVGR